MYSSKELGMRVKKARQHRSTRSGIEFTQKQLAAKIGETTKWVKKLEHGEFYPDWDALNFIADVCGVDIKFLIGENIDQIEYEEAISGGETSRTIEDKELEFARQE